MSVQKRIEEVIRQHQPTSGYPFCECSTPDKAPPDGDDWSPVHVAAAVQDVLEVWLPPLFASAIHAYADSELRDLPDDDPKSIQAMGNLNLAAAGIALDALTSSKWRDL